MSTMNSPNSCLNDVGSADLAAKPASFKRKSLIVGINNYPEPNHLPSCVADAHEFASLLQDRFGFEDQKLLLNEDATKANLINELKKLFADVGSSDRLVFFFSGHGYRPVRNGVLESALVTQDAQFFEDNELAELMRDVPSAVLTLVTDACFSGGLEKLFVGANGQIEVGKLKRWIALDAQEVELHREQASEITRFSPFGYLSPVPQSALQANLSVGKAADFQVSQLRQSDSKAILVSACLEDETAAASTSKTSGLSAFTYALTSTIGSLGRSPSAQAVVQAAGQRLREIGVQQTPMLKCPPQPEALASHEFVLIDETGELSTPTSQEVSAHVEGARDAIQQAVARFAMSLMSLGRGAKAMPNNGTQGASADAVNKDFINDVARVAQVAATVAPFFMQSKAYHPNGGDGASKDWIDDVGRVAQVAATLAPIFMQSKAYRPNGGDGASKDWIDDVGRVAQVAATLAPIFMQSKAYRPNGGDGASKDWIDDVGRVAQVAATLAPIFMQSKAYRPNGGDGPSKDFLGDLNRPIWDPVVPIQNIFAQSKGYRQNGNVDKDFLGDIGRAAAIAAAVAAI